jgi:uncharacterized protein YbjQ (UPF0145 family)
MPPPPRWGACGSCDGEQPNRRPSDQSNPNRFRLPRIFVRDATRETLASAGSRIELAPMLISTMNDLPGYEVEEVLGEVFGLTVRSRNIGAQVGAGLKSLMGGELKGMTKMLAEGREHAVDRLTEEAEGKGANAIVAFRFDTSELGSTWTEICAYGTAVRARKL